MSYSRVDTSLSFSVRVGASQDGVGWFTAGEVGLG